MTPDTVHAIRLHAFGTPEVTRLEPITLPPPAKSEMRVRQTTIAFNYNDVFQRSGKYPLALLSGLGYEAADAILLRP